MNTETENTSPGAALAAPVEHTSAPTTVATPAPALGAIVFACGAGIACGVNQLDKFPVGQRYITYFSRSKPGTTPPRKADGTAMHCLLNCPVAQRKSGMQTTRAWGAEDDNPNPGVLIKCRIAAHLQQTTVAMARGKEGV